MAIYPRLSLRYGGGILSHKQQAEQEENTVNILIGLGGTGIDCIKTIKAAVRERLLPDDPEAAAPEYSHIRFLGVDILEAERISGKKKRKSGIWDSPEKMDVLEEEEIFSLWAPSLIYYRCRQLNRLCFIRRSDKFADKLELMLEEAGKGLEKPDIRVHVFTSLSGATGAGIFLDVCYILREILKERHGVIFGYFFLPDVNLSRVSPENRLMREHIPVAAYAAMKELNYCMRIHENGGAFTQTYKGRRKIPWAEPPVNFPFVIAGTREDGTPLPNAYEYAINLVSEYILFHLTKRKNGDGYDLNCYMPVWSLNMTDCERSSEIGACMRYMTLGGASARIPYREMNTWLMAEVFQKISDRAGEIFDKTLKARDRSEEDRERIWKVLENLQETFLDNLKVLEEEKEDSPKEEEEFFYDLITLEEMKPELEKELAKVQPEEVLVKLLERLLQEENREALEDEERIAGILNRFFTEEIFPEFTDWSAENFLRKKYKSECSEVVGDELYEKVMKRLVKNSAPFFPFNPQVWDKSKTGGRGTIAVPESTSALIAAKKIYYESTWYQPEVRMKDRILIWDYRYAFPLGAYLKCPEYEQAYYSPRSAYKFGGLHSYEGGGECPFNDWRKLPSLIPLSCRKIR